MNPGQVIKHIQYVAGSYQNLNQCQKVVTFGFLTAHVLLFTVFRLRIQMHRQQIVCFLFVVFVLCEALDSNVSGCKKACDDKVLFTLVWHKYHVDEPT